MTTRPAPELPAWLAAMLPQRRGMFALSRGESLHFIDHGEGPTVLLLHGNPTWSFLWRGVIARLPSMRCVAPDLLGLGLSSRIAMREHSVDRHADALAEFVVGMDLSRVVVVGQDWGGALAASLGARVPERIAGLVLANTSVLVPAAPKGTWFHRLARVPVLSDLLFRGLGVPQVLLHAVQGDRGSIRGDVARAYRWPLGILAERVAPLALARLVPSRPDHPSLPALRRGEAWVRGFTGPMALVWGERDPILGRGLARHVAAFPQASVIRTQAGHFLQEEVPDALAEAIVDVVRRAGLR
jgi:pimeloyl-ACP methyl ester carboxylesterase